MQFLLSVFSLYTYYKRCSSYCQCSAPHIPDITYPSIYNSIINTVALITVFLHSFSPLSYFFSFAFPTCISPYVIMSRLFNSMVLGQFVTFLYAVSWFIFNQLLFKDIFSPFYVHVTVLHRNKFLYNTTTRCTNFINTFCHETLHVSDSSSVHHQEFIRCTLSNGICHTGL